MMAAISARYWGRDEKLWRCWRFSQHTPPSGTRSPVDDYDAAIEMNDDDRGCHLVQKKYKNKKVNR